MNETPPAALRFAVLGPVRAWSGERELNLGPRQQRQVLALLLIRAGRNVAVHEFVKMLWGYAAPPSAVNSLHRFIGSLRRILEPGLPARDGGRWLVRHDAAYRLVTPPGSVDLMEFRRLADEAREADGLGLRDVAVDRYMEALQQSRGRCADDASSGPRYSAFLAIDEEYASVARDAAGAAVAYGRVGQVLPAVRRAAELNPLDEGLHARLMLLLAADGRQADAFALFQEVRTALARELGVDPGRELRAAYDEVLRPRAASGPSFSTRVNPAQLPRDLPVFTGRRAELDRLTGLLRAAEKDAAMPIIAIDGMAGVGKSTLAVHWAHKMAAQFPDGQIYLNLREHESPADALHSMLSTLGATADSIPAGVSTRAALFRSHIAGRRVLVLLDNAASVDQVRPLLPGTASCLVVITSRPRLTALTATDSAHLVTLGLPGPEDALRMLTRRLVASHGEQWAARTEVLEDLVAACGRLPVALAVVAAEAALHPDRLSVDAHSFDCIFAESYATLGAPAARLLRLLAQHAGQDVTSASAAAFADLPVSDVRAQLDELARAHLLEPTAEGRFALHVLVRTYAGSLRN